MEPKFKNVQVGDRMIRILGGKIALNVVVSRVTHNLIICVPPPEERERTRASMERVASMLGIPPSEKEMNEIPEWSFSINNGAEMDYMLGWDEIYTGSYIVKPEKI